MVDQDSESNHTRPLYDDPLAGNTIDRINIFVNGRKLLSEDVRAVGTVGIQQVWRMWKERPTMITVH